jgi:CheY-like chemotaxis protein
MTSQGSTELPPPEPALEERGAFDETDLVTKPLRLILVVDEDADVRAFLKGALMQSGFGVWVAPSAKPALTILRERRIDLIVGDASRFEPDGEKTLRKLRRSRRGTKILAMTGALPAIASASVPARRGVHFPRRGFHFPLLQPEWLEARFFLGAHATLPKPVSLDLLIETVKKLLRDTA